MIKLRRPVLARVAANTYECRIDYEAVGEKIESDIWFIFRLTLHRKLFTKKVQGKDLQPSGKISWKLTSTPPTPINDDQREPASLTVVWAKSMDGPIGSAGNQYSFSAYPARRPEDFLIVLDNASVVRVKPGLYSCSVDYRFQKQKPAKDPGFIVGFYLFAERGFRPIREMNVLNAAFMVKHHGHVDTILSVDESRGGPGVRYAILVFRANGRDPKAQPMDRVKHELLARSAVGKIVNLDGKPLERDARQFAPYGWDSRITMKGVPWRFSGRIANRGDRSIRLFGSSMRRIECQWAGDIPSTLIAGRDVTIQGEIQTGDSEKIVVSNCRLIDENATPKMHVIEISAAQFAKDSVSKNDRERARFNDAFESLMRVTGEVTGGDAMTVVLKGDNGIDITCEFTSAEAASKLKTGETVTIEGILATNRFSKSPPLLKACTQVRKP